MQAFYNEDLPHRHKGHSCKLPVKILNMYMLNKHTSLHENPDVVIDKSGENGISFIPCPHSTPNTCLKDLIMVLPQASQIRQT